MCYGRDPRRLTDEDKVGYVAKKGTTPALTTTDSRQGVLVIGALSGTWRAIISLVTTRELDQIFDDVVSELDSLIEVSGGSTGTVEYAITGNIDENLVKQLTDVITDRFKGLY